jgi:hypothetical protein
VLCDRRCWLAGFAAVVILVLSCGVSPGRAAPSAAQRLVDAYSPIVMMGEQSKDVCDASDEQYGPPTSVDVVLANPRVRLMVHVARKNRLVMLAPTVADIAGRGAQTYLDLPGSPLSPRCKYAKDFAAIRRAGHAPAVTYAHLDREPGHPGLAVQYWFSYYFNHFNDLHESDWEGMQITFPGDTPAQALASGPDEIVVFQHSGGERTSWDDPRVQKQGTHPVVYSAKGSHATFYSSALWLGNGQNGSGVGCDNTTGPLTEYRPRPVLLPDNPVSTGPFAWTSFTGRWGQRESGFNTGPTGPNTKSVWKEPFTWMAGTRTASPEVPGGSLIGPSVAHAFCGAVARVTSFTNLAAKTQAGAIGLVVGALAALAVLVSLTTWRPVALDPVRARRAVGQILLTSARAYARYLAPLMLIALSSLVILAALEAIEWLICRALGVNRADLSLGDYGLTISVATSAGLGRTIAAPIASAAVIAYIRDLDDRRNTSFLSAWTAAAHRIWRLVLVQVVSNLLVIAMLLSIIAIPFAIKKFVDWQLAQQEVLFEDRSIRQALRASTRVVHGHWWHTGMVAGTLWLLSQIPGPALTFALLFTTVPVGTVNLIGSIIFALLIPYVTIGRTLLYLDLKTRRAAQPRETTPDKTLPRGQSAV